MRRRRFIDIRRIRLGSDIHGGAAVEAAIVIPVLMLLGFGALDASMLYQQTHRMEAGLAAAGSYLAVSGADSAQQTRARHVAVTGETSAVANAKPRVTGWEASDVTIVVRSIDNSSGTYRAGTTVRVARISSSTPYRGLGFVRRASGGRIDVTGSYETRLTL